MFVSEIPHETPLIEVMIQGVCKRFLVYRYAPHIDVSVDDEPHIRRWSHKIIILYYNTNVLQLPKVFSTVTCCTGLQTRSISLYHIA